MKVYKDWEIYTPFENDSNKEKIAAGAMFIRDGNGTDWYDLIEELLKLQNVYYVLVDSRNDMVLCYGNHPRQFSPLDMIFCVTEKLPDGFEENYQHFRLSGKKFVPDNRRKIEYLTDYISEEQSWASTQISTLNDIQEFGTPTKEEESRLLALRKYRFTLTRIKPEDNPDVDLPDRP